MKNKKIALVLVLAAMPLVACTPASSSGSQPATSSSTTSASSSVSSSAGPVDKRANGVINYAAAPYAEKNKMIAAEEGYILDNFLGGIPLYDSGGTVLYNSRLSGLLPNYIANYGFGVGRATITADMDAEPTAAFKRYYHGFETANPATYNAANAKDSVSSDMNDMFTLSYYQMKPNATSDGYEWYPVLAKEKPIAMNPDENGMATKWKIKVHANEDGFVYNTLSAKANLAAFKGQRIQLEDYLTMYKLTLDNQWNRASDMSNPTMGFKGVQDYSDAISGGKTADWSKVGIQINAADNSLEFEFLTKKNPFYAMYYVSSGMYAPLPESFISALDTYKTGTQTGASLYGIFRDKGAGASGLDAVDSVLSVGTYVPELIEDGTQLVFKKNDTCCIASEFHFAGYKEWIWTAAAESATYAYDQYKAGLLDAVGVPASKISAESNNPEKRKTKGDTVWKLQVNACNQVRWNELFGDNGSVSQQGDNAYLVKPVMSNKNFLNGVYASIDRSSLSDTLGRTPAQGYLSGAYDYDPELGLAYRDSDEGKAVLASRDPETLGFNKAKAEALFDIAVQQEQAKGNYLGGTAAEPVTITLDAWYQSQSDIDEEGGLEAGYIEDAFNAACLTKYGVKLDIVDYAPTVWSDVYYQHMMIGKFDFGFGSISGNTLDPLSFLDTVCSDNRSTFTLSWGPDTSICEYDEETNEGAIMYDDKAWSFDALFEAGTAGTIVTQGESTPAFFYGADAAGGEADIAVADFTTGTNDFSFTMGYYVDEQVSITIDRITWYDLNTSSETAFVVADVLSDDDNGKFTISVTGLDMALTAQTKNYSYGYVCIYYTQVVAGVSTTGLEKDVAVVFYAA